MSLNSTRNSHLLDDTSEEISTSKLLSSPSLSSASLSAASLSSTRSENTKEDRGSGIFGACCNFINCVIGAGIIGTGGAVAESGYAIAMVMLLLCALLTKYSLDLLIEVRLLGGGGGGVVTYAGGGHHLWRHMPSRRRLSQT